MGISPGKGDVPIQGWLESIPPPIPRAASHQPKVGGRLRDFWRVWLKAGALPSVVRTLRDGLLLDFLAKPPLNRKPSINSAYPDMERNLLLLEAVDGMLLKGVIVPVKNVTSPGFYSRLFLVPKKSGGWRPVIDLSAHNRFIRIPSFKMETAEFIRGHLQKSAPSISRTHISISRWPHKLTST